MRETACGPSAGRRPLLQARGRAPHETGETPATPVLTRRHDTEHGLPPPIATRGWGLKGRTHDVRRGRTLSICLLHAPSAHAPQRGARDGRGGAGPVSGGAL